MSIVQTLDRVHGDISEAQKNTSSEAAKREFAIAKTHVEDAMMRVNRGFAHKAGRFRISDAELEFANEMGSG